MQNGLECHCGNEMVSIIKSNENYCNTKCPVFNQYKCGGNGAISVYDVSLIGPNSIPVLFTSFIHFRQGYSRAPKIPLAPLELPTF